MAENQDDMKQQLRAAVRRSRRERSREAQRHTLTGFTEQLTSLVIAREARAVSCYLPLPGEPDTSGFIEWAQKNGVELFFPVSRADRRLDWARLSAEGTRTGLHGIREPIGEALPATTLSSVDLLLIPACAVDMRGARLGWGLGYYDRLLASLSPCPPAFAVVHDNEALPFVPSAPHDVLVSGIVTPTQIRLLTNEPE